MDRAVRGAARDEQDDGCKSNVFIGGVPNFADEMDLGGIAQTKMQQEERQAAWQHRVRFGMIGNDPKSDFSSQLRQRSSPCIVKSNNYSSTGIKTFLILRHVGTRNHMEQ